MKVIKNSPFVDAVFKPKGPAPTDRGCTMLDGDLGVPAVVGVKVPGDYPETLLDSLKSL